MLVVGEGARVSAEVSCGTIIVHGEVQGNIRAKNAVELHHPAKMRGNVETPSFMIEKGVIFEGQCKMENLQPPIGARPASPRPCRRSRPWPRSRARRPPTDMKKRCRAPSWGPAPLRLRGLRAAGGR